MRRTGHPVDANGEGVFFLVGEDVGGGDSPGQRLGNQLIRAFSPEPERSGDSLPNGSPEGVSEAKQRATQPVPPQIAPILGPFGQALRINMTRNHLNFCCQNVNRQGL